jgi:hypothetical protein
LRAHRETGTHDCPSRKLQHHVPYMLTEHVRQFTAEGLQPYR